MVKTPSGKTPSDIRRKIRHLTAEAALIKEPRHRAQFQRCLKKYGATVGCRTCKTCPMALHKVEHDLHAVHKRILKHRLPAVLKPIRHLLPGKEGRGLKHPIAPRRRVRVAMW